MHFNQAYEQLTLRRIRVLGLIAEGYTIDKIAAALGFTHNGASSHVRDLERITGCSNLVEVREWWGIHGELWLAYVARLGGLARGYRNHGPRS